MTKKLKLSKQEKQIENDLIRGAYVDVSEKQFKKISSALAKVNQRHSKTLKALAK